MKKNNVFSVLLFLMSFTLLISSTAIAGKWAVLTNLNENTISTVDFSTSPATVYGPFLSGSLGLPGYYFLDIAITPDGKYALASSFGDETVYRIDLSDPSNPVLAGSVNIGFYAEDIAISRDGTLALVTDGGTSPVIAFIDLATFTLNGVYTLTTTAATAEAVDIAPDNQTVIVADFYNNRIIYGKVNAAKNGLESESTLPTGVAPVNVAISPDGATALVACYAEDFDDIRIISNVAKFNGQGKYNNKSILNVTNLDGNGISAAVTVFQITAPGLVVSGSTPSVNVLGGTQSIAFSPDGGKAYVISEEPSPDQLSWLQINGPGNVTLGGAGVANLNSDYNN